MSLPISGFTAVPNPQMLSYMMSQSWIMMYAAGGAWQYGKRRISAMSNEEFNKLLPIDLLKEHTTMLREAIPTIQRSIQDMTPLINTLMIQFGEFINEAIKAIPQTVSNILGTPGGEFSNIPTTAGQSGTGLPPPGTAAFLHYFKTLADATQATPEQIQAGGLQEFENTQAKRIELQKIETARVKRLQMELEAKARAQERLTQRQVVAAPHIISRAVSNVSMQSLRLEKANLLFQVRRALTDQQAAIKSFAVTKSWPAHVKRAKSHLIRQKQAGVAITTQTLANHRQKLANFMAMHGARF